MKAKHQRLILVIIALLAIVGAGLLAACLGITAPLAAQDPPKQGGGQRQAGQSKGCQGIHAVFRRLGAVCTSAAPGGKPLSAQSLKV